MTTAAALVERPVADSQPESGVSDAELRRAYEAGATANGLADLHEDLSADQVLYRLHRAGTTMRPPGSRTGTQPVVITDEFGLRQLHLRGWSERRIAAYYDCGRTAVRSAKRRFGLVVPPPPRRITDPTVLRTLYTERGWTLRRIVLHLGCGYKVVTTAIDEFDLVHRNDLPAFQTQVRGEYEAGAALKDLAEIHDMPAVDVSAVILTAGGTLRDHRPEPDALATRDAQLRAEYEADTTVSIRQLAERRGLPPSVVRTGLLRAGTTLRPRGGTPRLQVLGTSVTSRRSSAESGPAGGVVSGSTANHPSPTHRRRLQPHPDSSARGATG